MKRNVWLRLVGAEEEFLDDCFARLEVLLPSHKEQEAIESMMSYEGNLDEA